jgi:TonB-dependent receptor
MKLSLKSLAVCVALLSANGAWAADLLVSTFLQSRPFKGLEIELDGRNIGQTGDLGETMAPLEAGHHTLRVLKDDAQLAEYAFDVEDGQSAELSVTFSDFEQAPKIEIETYDAEADGTGAAGTIAGTVRDIAGEPVDGALVTIEELGAEVPADESGTFELELPRGRYTLLISHPDFETVRRENFRVIANVGVAANIVLRSKVAAAESGAVSAAAGDEEEVVVLGTYNPSENAADLEKFSVNITDAIDIDDLLRFGDSDVAAALKRIVGVAVTGGKYANVRGLAGRYISSTLNGSLMPSTDPFRRDVELDLFPSEILGSIEVQKSFSADLPGDTTGGAILMTTRGLPDEDEAGISLSVGYVTGVTGEDLLTYEGGDSDWAGADDGTRELPGAVRSILRPGGVGLAVSASDAAGAAATLPVIYNTQRESAQPNFGIAGKFGRRHPFASGDFGYYAAVTYDQSHESRQDAEFDNVQGDAEGETIWDTFIVSMNGYLVAGWEAYSGWSVTSKTMLLRDTEDRASIQASYDRSNTEVYQVDTTLEWIEREFVGQQLESVIPLFGEHELSLRGGVSRTTRSSPDRRFYEYRNNEFSVTPFERSYADLTEDAWEFGADYKWPIQITGSILTTLKFGLMSSRRDRDNELIRLGVSRGSEDDLTQDPETLLSSEAFESGRFTLRTSTAQTDSYLAVRETQAAYVSTETDLGTQWSLAVGARLEDYSLDLDYPYAQAVAGGVDASAISDRDSSDALPSLNLTYRIGEDIQLRGGYSQTVSRPDITELAASIFYDAEGRKFSGCPTCEDATIDNFDLRGEYYFGGDNSITLALFYKQIDSPLEVTLRPGVGDIRTFRNGESADLSGIELDANTRLIDGASHALMLSGNLAWIDSEIVLDEEAALVEGVDKRQLQGQSPFLANMQLAYDYYPFDANLTLAVNYFDDRIDSVVAGSQLDPIEEKGRFGVNLNAEKQFRNGSKLSLKIKNLLDAPIERTQSGRVRETYKLGTSLSLGYSLSF